MDFSRLMIAIYTLSKKESLRFLRIWPQTIVPPAVTPALYFLIFGTLIGPRIGTMGNFPYLEFMVPGLVMMSVISYSFMNTASSFFGAKFGSSIEEILVSPLPMWGIMFGYVSGGVVRGLVSGSITLTVSSIFTTVHAEHVPVMILVAILGATIFSTLGLVNGLFAKTFDDVNIIPNFILTPLIYVGGVFFSIDLLSDGWQLASKFNPILYIVDAFRYAMLDASTMDPSVSISAILLTATILIVIALVMLVKGSGLRP